MQTQKEIVNKKVFVFIVFLRVIASICITNTHFGKIWPNPDIAVGGLIGDILFFAISGFCLANSGASEFTAFAKKRIARIYPAVIIWTLFLIITGFWNVRGWLGRGGFLGIIYPTRFHFVETIVVLYIALYPCIRFECLKKRIPTVMTVVFALMLVLYLFADKTIRLDTATNPITRLLFFEVMLYGVYLRKNIDKNKNSVWHFAGVFASVAVYFVLKMMINEAKNNNFQFVILIALFFIAVTMCKAFLSAEKYLEKTPGFIQKILKEIADITLEIYLVQEFLIRYVIKLNLTFPVNFFAVVILILVFAFILKKISNLVILALSFLCEKGLKNKSLKNSGSDAR